MEKKLRPFFPGYLFLYLAPEERRRTAIRGTSNAIGAVHLGVYCLSVPDAVIAAMQSLENDSGFICRGEDP